MPLDTACTPATYASLKDSADTVVGFYDGRISGRNRIR
ncbi:hypothetical protein BRPE64_CCDS05150 [Caballeronia insecticola]|uniref:Uncharacterized protein n=1 Tax=Caballeronia insecticola TaxID=758793 RepID=R4WPJ2_9BURK|nr:hypothetical protein BRPE64_CCDS05150 [Caballeronia insecticola]